jgi:hypothetical protein
VTNFYSENILSLLVGVKFSEEAVFVSLLLKLFNRFIVSLSKPVELLSIFFDEDLPSYGICSTEVKVITAKNKPDEITIIKIIKLYFDKKLMNGFSGFSFIYCLVYISIVIGLISTLLLSEDCERLIPFICIKGKFVSMSAKNLIRLLIETGF